MSNLFQAEYFTRRQIDEYRQCFNTYCLNGVISNVPQLRYIMRCLGYSPTVYETKQYFQQYKEGIGFAVFLNILRNESEKTDAIIEIMRALKYFDKNNHGSIVASEFTNILTSIGEKMTNEEIFRLLKQLNITNSNEKIPFTKLLRFISSNPIHFYS
ncbi:unnamed protein product [Dracunculus medinensis]|uniref:EF-hand domain-containing protein n=1 Tax=Dracunculus medinensis TaxID=318479 RepID=A0A3P7PJL5_DRAME|nr:unnamed protein product [Dracunculus medinensis]